MQRVRAGQVSECDGRDELQGMPSRLILRGGRECGAALPWRHVPKLDRRHLSEQLLDVPTRQLLPDWRDERDAMRRWHRLVGRRVDL